MFYLLAGGLEPGLLFPVTEYYAYVVGFNANRLTEELTELGFHLAGKKQRPRVDFVLHNDQVFFDELFDLVKRTAGELEETLQ